jgi:hypothetical protein
MTTKTSKTTVTICSRRENSAASSLKLVGGFLPVRQIQAKYHATQPAVRSPRILVTDHIIGRMFVRFSILLFLLFRGSFHLLQDLIQGGAIEQAAIGDYCADFLRVVDVIERVRGQQNEVGGFARLYGSEAGLGV